jgi:hemolysin III
MLVIAGSYTPLAWALLQRPKAVVLLWVIWSGAILGVLFRLLWTNAPRWLYVPIYIALGCGSLFYLPDFFAASIAAAVLICVGGALYIAGAVFYTLKKPNFSYEHFGFHELFHAFTVFAFAAHFIAIAIAVLGSPA